MSIDKIFKILVPKDKTFFPLFQKDADNLVAISLLLKEMFEKQDISERDEFIKKIKQLEKDGDEITHQIYKSLNSSFITPFDREDIHDLASAVDDVADFVNKVANMIKIYQPKRYLPEFPLLANYIVEASNEIKIAIDCLETMKDVDKFREACIKINIIENQADDVYHAAIKQLFDEEKNIGELIKLKEILQKLEGALDKAQNVGDVLQTVLVKTA